MKISKENPLKVVRERLVISRSELARNANISFMTVQRIEHGKPCRLDTKKKIVAALGFNPWLNNEGNSSPEL
jgi:DNA-binding XRE family transcriptional regulator